MKGIFLKQEEQGRWPPSVDDLAFGPPEVVIRFDTGRDLGRRGEQSDPRRRGLTSAAARRMRQGEQSLREMKVKERKHAVGPWSTCHFTRGHHGEEGLLTYRDVIVIVI